MTLHSHLRVKILRFVDDGFPGFVEVAFTEADGALRVIRDKYTMFTSQILSSESAYPQTGSFACTIVERWTDVDGKERTCIDLTPVEACGRDTRFVVFADALPSGYELR